MSSQPMPRKERGRLGGKTAARNATPEERAERARVAVNARWSRPGARAEAATTARATAQARHYAAADAAGITDPVLREQLARAAQREEMARIRAAKLRKARLARKAREAAQDDAEATG